jgi:alpha-mannosidase
MYNPWYTNHKVWDEQIQCTICMRWDKYFYEVRNKITQSKIRMCFQCYHKNLNQGLFEDVD